MQSMLVSVCVTLSVHVIMVRGQCTCTCTCTDTCTGEDSESNRLERYLKQMMCMMNQQNQQIVGFKQKINDLGEAVQKSCEGTPTPRNAQNCQDLLDQGYDQNGDYVITTGFKSIHVYCDQQTDGGGWLVIQRRVDASVDFYRDWPAYRKGFGDVSGNLWMGNTVIHQLTRSLPMELRIDMTTEDDTKVYAKYSHFGIGSETDKFALNISGYSGDAGGHMQWYHNTRPFSTRDMDNDRYYGVNCADEYRGGWWYNHCATANLNGLYGRRGQGIDWYQSIYWGVDRHHYLKFTEMKIRPSQ